jgi:hypothetical protein
MPMHPALSQVANTTTLLRLDIISRPLPAVNQINTSDQFYPFHCVARIHFTKRTLRVAMANLGFQVKHRPFQQVDNETDFQN